MIQESLTSITVTAEGHVVVRFGKVEIEYSSLADLKESVKRLDEDLVLARQILLAWWLKKDALLANPTVVQGRSVTFDLTALSLLVVA